MNKQMRELLEKKDKLHNDASEFLNKAKTSKDEAEKKDFKAKARKALDEIKALEEDYKLEEDMFNANKGKVASNPNEPKNDHKKEFFNALRMKMSPSEIKNTMQIAVPADGGVLVPQDILTRINELREKKDALQNLVNIEPVTTMTGSRVFKARAQQTGFALVAEGGVIGNQATPLYTTLNYTINKYAGIFPVTNELLADSDQAIEAALIKWVGDESRVTRNQLILNQLQAIPPTALADADAIKTALNVTLDPAFRYTATLVTNQDGYNWLDQLTDANGHYLLQPSVAAPTGFQIFGVPITMISNRDMPSDAVTAAPNTLVPMYIGDLKEAITLFDRQSLSIKSSDVADSAFTNDMTLFRAIEREDVVTRDATAVIYGQVTI